MSAITDGQSETTSDHSRHTRRRARVFAAEPFLLMAIFVCLVLLARLFPLSGDDWAWGTSIGLDRLRNHFDGYNGRWAGNLAVLVLTRSSTLAAITVSGVLCAILVLLTRISGLSGLAGYATALAALLLMPLGTWRQTVVWLSGFSNYVLSTAGLLVFIWMTRRILLGDPFTSPRLVAACVVPIAAVSALFVEHVTVALVASSAAALIVVLRRGRPWLVPAAWAAGSVAGAGIMFSNAAYRNVARGASTYQRVDSGGAGTLLEHATGGVSHLAMAANLGLNTCLVAVLGALAWRARRRSGTSSRWALTSVASGTVGLAGSAAVTAVAPTGTSWSWVSALGMVVALLLAAVSLVTDPERRVMIVATLGLVVILVAPATIMRPYGPRNFFPTYVLLILVLLLLLRELLADEPWEELRAVIAALGLGTATAVLAGYFAVYAQINDHNDQRREVIRSAVSEGRGKILVPRTPFPEYIHHPDPVNKIFLERFKLFHGIPRSTKVRFTS